MSFSSVVCQNLGPAQTRRRRLMGYVLLNVGLVLALVFIWLDVNDSLRALVFIPFFFGYLGIIQAIQKTCVVLAMKGLQNLDQGCEKVADSPMQSRLKVRAIWILIFAAALALLCTYLTLAIRTEHLQWPRAI